jgi:sugar fermentation stimulation protein A
MVHDGKTWIGVNTSRTNALVAEAIESGRIEEFRQVESIQREVKVSANSRLDLAVTHQGTLTYVEIKNCSLVEDGCAMFPDAVTARGTKHLRELMGLIENGKGGCIFFLVQRMDADTFAPAAHIDPLYSVTLKEAVQKGVTVLAYQAEVTPQGIDVIRKLPCTL